MAKVVFKSYNQNDYLLFPPCLGDFIAENDTVRVLNAVVDHMDIRAIEDSYEGGGARRFHYRSKELVEAEFATLATAHNIRKMASVINGERSRQAAVTSRKACPPSDTLEGGARRIQVIAKR